MCARPSTTGSPQPTMPSSVSIFRKQPARRDDEGGELGDLHVRSSRTRWAGDQAGDGRVVDPDVDQDARAGADVVGGVTGTVEAAADAGPARTGGRPRREVGLVHPADGEQFDVRGQDGRDGLHAADAEGVGGEELEAASPGLQRGERLRRCRHPGVGPQSAGHRLGDDLRIGVGRDDDSRAGGLGARDVLDRGDGACADDAVVADRGGEELRSSAADRGSSAAPRWPGSPPRPGRCRRRPRRRGRCPAGSRRDRCRWCGSHATVGSAFQYCKQSSPYVGQWVRCTD